MVGNTYPYQLDDWRKDINLALVHGIDGFALNIGSDDWQEARVADAYKAAQGTKFQLFISFDMAVIPCGLRADAERIRKYITDYQSHPNQMKFNGSIVASTFAGESCRFGTNDLNQGWLETLKSADMPPVWFIPSLFVDPSEFPRLTVMDGYFSWNAGWPTTNQEVTFETDKRLLDQLGGRGYMAPCSPWFFTHYGPETYNKNFMYSGDNWLFAERWEHLIANRAHVDMVEVLTWNDYGESHYIGPIEGAQPMSEAWVNGFDHQGWLDLQQYYISAFKSGVYPSVLRDRIFLWARLYPADADAPQDGIGRPSGWQYTEDFLWAMIFSTGGNVSVTLRCGDYAETAELSGTGAFKLRMPLTGPGGQVSATLWRDGAGVVDLIPAGFVFSRYPTSYNFNAFVASSR
ncbi:glycoside hydrolase family 71 protein [Thelephora ganbajun]|uniref:Glycoside hydrolase family 71 protein n=1 Tax=Thelephora ganbajun TaxID=370292 RepID=A0ACB6ZGU6_THEGA|nr:glycoside hydrolase family 71 protein [Thelephora ganbajun]